jgi:hypothetical protein
MGRYRHGHARLDQGAGNWQCCDRCGFVYSHADLQWQYEWAGTRLQNTQYQVCAKCLDVPSAILRTIIPGPDPVPIPNVRAMPFSNWNDSFIATENLEIIETEDGDSIILEE